MSPGWCHQIYPEDFPHIVSTPTFPAFRGVTLGYVLNRCCSLCRLLPKRKNRNNRAPCMYIPFRRYGTTGFVDWLIYVTCAWVRWVGLGHTFWSSLMTSASDWDGEPRGDSAYSEREKMTAKREEASFVSS